jgi:hypothetical protein
VNKPVGKSTTLDGILDAWDITPQKAAQISGFPRFFQNWREKIKKPACAQTFGVSH